MGGSNLRTCKCVMDMWTGQSMSFQYISYPPKMSANSLTVECWWTLLGQHSVSSRALPILLFFLPVSSQERLCYKVWWQAQISALFLPIRREPVRKNTLFIALCKVQLAINTDETQLPKAQYAAAGLWQLRLYPIYGETRAGSESVI